jgi:DNA-binding NarL/FixJ family response regulator
VTSILLADDHEIVRRGLRGLLEEHPGWTVCGEARDGGEAVELAVRLRPQVVILDVGMPVLNGLEAAQQIKQYLPESEVLVFTMHETEQLVREVFATGARGFVVKSDAGQHLVAAVEALLSHKPFCTVHTAAMLVGDRPPVEQWRSPSSMLTTRQREIVQLLAEGKSSKQVATLLCISTKTVETHRATIMRKLGLNSVVELVRYAIRNHIINA